MLLGALCLVLLVKIKRNFYRISGAIFLTIYFTLIFLLVGLWVGCPECRSIRHKDHGVIVFPHPSLQCRHAYHGASFPRQSDLEFDHRFLK